MLASLASGNLKHWRIKTCVGITAQTRRNSAGSLSRSRPSSAKRDRGLGEESSLLAGGSNAGSHQLRSPHHAWRYRHAPHWSLLRLCPLQPLWSSARLRVSCCQLVGRQPGWDACSISPPAASTIRLLRRSHYRLLRNHSFVRGDG